VVCLREFVDCTWVGAAPRHGVFVDGPRKESTPVGLEDGAGRKIAAEAHDAVRTLAAVRIGKPIRARRRFDGDGREVHGVHEV
jgi:GTPase involved in cell partitioning and DNA repair